MKRLLKGHARRLCYLDPNDTSKWTERELELIARSKELETPYHRLGVGRRCLILRVTFVGHCGLSYGPL